MKNMKEDLINKVQLKPDCFNQNLISNNIMNASFILIDKFTKINNISNLLTINK